MNLRFPTAVVTITLLAPCAANADTIDDFVRARQKRDHVPGIAIAVLKDGKVVRRRGYGLADVEHNARVTASTPFQLASVTKQFTAVAVLMLMEEGKLKLDDKAIQHLPDLPDAWRDVTVRQLLNHTSGIKSYTNVASFRTTFRKDFTQTEIVDVVKNEPLEFAPGAGWNYNNTGFFLLGMLIEKLTGKTYGAFLAERIFQPLGMTRTRVNDLGIVIPGRGRGYSWRDDQLVNGEYISPTQAYAAGALVSTIDDMARWEGALASGNLLKKSSYEQMWTPTRLPGRKEGYGFGWWIDEINGHRRISHSGGIPGFATEISRFVNDRITIIVLCNSDSTDADSLAKGIARRFIPTLTPTTPKAVAVAPETIRGISGYYDREGRIGAFLRRSGQLSLDGETLKFSAPDTFFLANFDVSLRLQKFRAVKDSAGQVKEVVKNEERRAARIGPLANDAPPQHDPDTALTRRLEATLKALAQGEKNLDSFPVTPGFKSQFAGTPLPELVGGVKDISFVAAFNVADRGILRFGSKVSRVLYYKLSINGAAKYILIYLTDNGLMADEDVVKD
ncbi:serine hydrolase domain-containing protein [Armatimonas sp.]|uniref:serine hydrolase domain-containing protein n=1 Tax=Armatimonas sp. TaxID=1872638 RepID=UPI00286BA7D5|nr:serine hydrolase domain-containing protein [Armatimonas sp.]